MRIGELLVAEKLITQAQLDQALASRALHPSHSIGWVISKSFDIPMEIVETILITKLVIPEIKTWLKKNIDQKTAKDGIPLSSTIKDIEIKIPSYTRYEGEAVTYIRNKKGYYSEDNRNARSKRLSLIIETIQLTTRRKQKIILHDIHLEMVLKTNTIKAENPGFITEARLKLLHALKQKGTMQK